MKKLVAFICVVLMLVAGTTFSETVPSKIGSLPTVTVLDPENFYIVAEEDEELTANEFAKVQEEENILDYFGEEAAGEILTVLGADAQPVLEEFCSAIAVNWTPEVGDATAKIQCATPFEEGQKVAILIGIVRGGEIEWHVFEGVGCEKDPAHPEMDGAVLVTFDAATVEAIAKYDTILAVLAA